MPRANRDWNEYQRQALERLSEAINNNELLLNRPEADSAAVGYREALRNGGVLEVSSLMRGGGPPSRAAALRGRSAVAECWIDSHEHVLWIAERDEQMRIRWLSLGPDEHYECRMWNSSRWGSLAMVRWGSLAMARSGGRLLLRRLPESDIIRIQERREEARSRREARGIRGHRADGIVNDEIDPLLRDRSFPVAPADNYLVIRHSNSGELSAPCEILCGPFNGEDILTEFASICAYEPDLIAVILSGSAARSRCTDCLRPAGYLHQAHCPRRLSTIIDD